MSEPQPATVITGAAGFLGAELARCLLDRGHRIVAVDTEDRKERLDVLVASAEGRIVSATADCTDRGSLDDALEGSGIPITELSGAVLVAGGWGGGRPLHEEDGDATWRRMLDMNLETARQSLVTVLPKLVERGKGSVVVIGSQAVERPWTGKNAAAYTASKAAVVALAQAVAAEVLNTGVRVNAVLPSTIDTPANREGMPQADFSKWVSPEAVSRVIAFLLSDDAAGVSGAALPVYGRS